MKKWTPEQIETLKELWKQHQSMKDLYMMKIDELEEIGKTNLGIAIEFFFTDDGCVGIGTADREYELLQQEALEDERQDESCG